MTTLLQDLRIAVRSLRRTPAFTAAVALTLALGIGGTTAIFSLIHAVILRPLPFHEPDRLVHAGGAMPGEYLLFGQEARAFDELALLGPTTGVNFFAHDRPERVGAAHVSSNLFRTLGVGPARGRDLRAEDGQPGAESVVLLSDEVWRDRLGADPDVVGRSITIDGTPRAVVGVLPPGLRFPDRSVQVWLPLTIDPADPVGLWGGWGGQLVGRLTHGASASEARAELISLIPRVREANTLWAIADDYGLGREVVGLRDSLAGGAATPLLVLAAAAGFILLIACANVANLLLARSLARRRELAIRAALGARRSRIVRQLLTESMTLAVLSGALGVLGAAAVTGALARGLPVDTPLLADAGLHGPVLAVAALTTLLVGIAFGLFPALRSTPTGVGSGLREGVQSSGSAPERKRMSDLLVIGEIACAVVLVISAGLMARSLGELVRIDPGFDPEQRVSARVTPQGAANDTPDGQRAFHAGLLEEVRARPGLSDAELVDRLPLASDAGAWAGFAFETEDARHVPGTAAPTVAERRVTPGYARLMGIALLAGRPLNEEDRAGTPHVALINEAMAREHWPGLDPLGRRFRPVWWQEDWITVVGVVADVRQQSLAEAVEPEIYRPLPQSPTGAVTLVARSAAGPTAIAGLLRDAVAAVDPQVPVTEIRSLEEVRAGALAEPRVLSLLLGGVAVLALALGAIGVYGVIAFAVGRRMREFGVRRALGARDPHVLRLVVGHGVGLVAWGTAFGLVATLLAAGVLEGLLHGVSTRDPLTFVTVPLILGATALLASWVPARRATRVDPMTVLREE